MCDVDTFQVANWCVMTTSVCHYSRPCCCCHCVCTAWTLKVKSTRDLHLTVTRLLLGYIAGPYQIRNDFCNFDLCSHSWSSPHTWLLFGIRKPHQFLPPSWSSRQNMAPDDTCALISFCNFVLFHSDPFSLLAGYFPFWNIKTLQGDEKSNTFKTFKQTY